MHVGREDFEVQKDEVAQKAVGAYKASEECHWEKLNFARLTFAERLKDTRKKVLKHHLDLNMDFFYEDEYGDKASSKVCRLLN